jgi:3-oxoacyl-[acyl-carrier protein] reductase
VNNRPMDLNGRVALVTGGSRGIGRAIAIAMADAGADVAVNYKENKAAAEEVVVTISKSGRRAFAFGADVSVSREVDSMIAAITRQLGDIEILVNNAGIARGRKLEEVDLATFDEAISVNLRSAFLVTSAVLPAMRRGRWGRLIFISSTAANVGGIVGPHYAASKAGMIGLMHSYASQLVKEGITANVVSPALVETDMVRSDLRVRPDRIPVGRFGRVEEVADVAVMLARNGYITGQSINVNGGLYPTS